MAGEILRNSCRICFKESTKLKSLYSEDDYEESPREMLEKLTGILMEQEQELLEIPKQACRICISELNLAYQFRRKALESQSFIELFCERQGKKARTTKEQKIIPNQASKAVPSSADIVKESMGTFEFDFDADCTLSTNAKDSKEYLMINDQNAIEECTSLSITQVAEDCNILNTAENIYVEVCTLPNNEEDSTENYNEHCNLTRITLKPSRQHVKKKTKIEKQLNSEASGLTGNAWTNCRTLSKRGRKPKSAVEEDNTFICDICGNRFSKRSRLTEHRYRHETELRFSCEICGERFLMREMLRRHMFLHVGEKPYKCSHCTRTFFYESVKKSHEAVHAGHKPYKCNKCEKAFAYPHSLKKHELIHEDIKLYHCRYCDKDFRLQHHLQQHEKSILHTKAVRKFEKLNKN